MRMTKWMLLLMGLLAFICMIGACQSNDDGLSDDDSSGDDADSALNVNEATQSGCLSHKAGDGNEEIIKLKYSGGVLSITHENACRGCALSFYGEYSVDGGVLDIVEGDATEMSVLCSCSYNLTYSVPDVDAAPYQLVISTWDESSGSGHQLLEESVDFSEESSDEFSLGDHECG